MSATPRVIPVPRRHPRIGHAKSYLRGDSLKAIRTYARRKFWGVDQNGTVDLDGTTWVNHWPKVWKGSWRWVATGRTDAKDRELRVRNRLGRGRKIQTMPTELVARLRSRKRGGRRLYRARTHMAIARAAGIHWCFEAKNSPGFQRLDVWKRLAADAGETEVAMVVMTLSSQGGNLAAFERLRLAHQAGFRNLAVLPRGRKPDWWDDSCAEFGMDVKVWNRTGVWK